MHYSNPKISLFLVTSFYPTRRRKLWKGVSKTLDHSNDLQHIVVLVTDVYLNRLNNYSIIDHGVRRISYLTSLYSSSKVQTRVRTIVNSVCSVIQNTLSWPILLLGYPNKQVVYAKQVSCSVCFSTWSSFAVIQAWLDILSHSFQSQLHILLHYIYQVYFWRALLQQHIPNHRALHKFQFFIIDILVKLVCIFN